MTLFAHPTSQTQRMGEDLLQRCIGGNLAADAAVRPAEIGAQGFEDPIGALDLVSVRIIMIFYQNDSADPGTGLAQSDAALLRPPY